MFTMRYGHFVLKLQSAQTHLLDRRMLRYTASKQKPFLLYQRQVNFFAHSGLQTASFGPIVAEVDSFDPVGVIFSFLLGR